MAFTMKHTNINVMDLEKTVTFYKEALEMKETRRKETPNGDMLVFLTDAAGLYELEVTWLRERKEPYDLSDNEIHMAFATDDIMAAQKKHAEMGCIAYENKAMNIYFIEDPDGYWIEIIPA